MMNRIRANQTVKPRIRDFLLNSLTISSGAIDVISFVSLGRVFTAFMTGNIAFLGLKVSGNSAPDVISILSSMLAFAFGVVVSTQIVRSIKDPVFWSNRITDALIISLIAQVVFLATWFSTKGLPSPNEVYFLISFWAFAMGMQSAAVRRLRVEGVFTTAATATFIFLAGDIINSEATSAERRRLAGILISLFIGATAGGLLLSYAHIYAPLLPFVINLAVVIIASVYFREDLRSNIIQVRLSES